MKNIPTLPELPLIGSTLAALASDTRFRARLVQQYVAEGGICRLHAGPYTFVMVADPQLGQEMLTRTEEFDKTPTVTASARPAFGTGILMIPNGPHRARRRTIQPAFNHSRVATYTDTIASHATQHARQWRDGQIIDLGQEMTSLTLRVIGKIMFGRDDLGDKDELGQAITATFDYMKTAFLLPFPATWPLPHNLRLRHARAVIDQVIYDTLVRHRAGDAEEGPDLLSLLLAARDDEGRGLTDEEIRDDAMSILVAGHETTAYTLTFALYLLSKHPTAYARLQQEVHDVLGERPPLLADLARLPYTTQVIKETLRLLPVAHALPRQARCDTTLGGYEVRKGWFVSVDVWELPHHPQHFPHPLHFDLDRGSPARAAHPPQCLPALWQWPVQLVLDGDWR